MSTVEEGICGICGIRGPLPQIEEHFMSNHTDAGDISAEVRPLENNPTSTVEKGQLRWAPQEVILLIGLVEKHYELFNSGLKKNVWQRIAEELSSISNKKCTFDQVENKWKGLKKTYKKVKDHNSKSGNDRRSWEFFQIIDGFMAKRPEIVPPAVCDTSDGLKINEVDNITPPPPSTSNDTSTSSFMNKRKKQENTIEKRHREKMARYDRFLDLFEKLVDHQTGKELPKK